MASPICPDCQRPLEGGYMLSNDGTYPTVGTWVQGAPEKSRWTGLKLKGKRQLPVYGWRCPSCMQVRLYAPE